MLWRGRWRPLLSQRLRQRRFVVDGGVPDVGPVVFAERLESDPRGYRSSSIVAMWASGPFSSHAGWENPVVSNPRLR